MLSFHITFLLPSTFSSFLVNGLPTSLERAGLSFLSHLVYCSLRSDQSLSINPNKRCRYPVEVTVLRAPQWVTSRQTKIQRHCVRCSSWRYTEGDCKSKYCITGNFCSQISMALNEGGVISGFNCVTICLDAWSGSINPYTSFVNPASWL